MAVGARCSGRYTRNDQGATRAAEAARQLLRVHVRLQNGRRRRFRGRRGRLLRFRLGLHMLEVGHEERQAGVGELGARIDIEDLRAGRT